MKLSFVDDQWISENSIISDRSHNFSSPRICSSTGKWNRSYTRPEGTGEICQVAASSTSFWHFDMLEIYKVLGCLVYSHQEAQAIEIWIDSGAEDWFPAWGCVEVRVFCLHAYVTARLRMWAGPIHFNSPSCAFNFQVFLPEAEEADCNRFFSLLDRGQLVKFYQHWP